MTEAEFKTILPIAAEHAVYRQVHLNDLDKAGRFPKAKHFIPHSDGLSTNWKELTTLKEAFYIIGLSYKFGKTIFKNIRDFRMFELPVQFLRSLEGITSLEHSPTLNGDPAAIGTPNIHFHASLVFGDDEEIRLKLSTYCNDEYQSCYLEADYDSLEPAIEDLRQKLQETKYHRLELMG